MKRQTVALIALLFAALPTSSFAQLKKEAPIVFSHYDLRVKSIPEHMKFWATTLGGVPDVFRKVSHLVKFENVLVFVKELPSTGPSKGTTTDHFGLEVPDLRATVNKLRAAGYPLITRQEIPAGVKVEYDGDIAIIQSNKVSAAYVMGPDGVKLELVENRALKAPASLHHIHFFSPQAAEMQAWYEKVFGTKLPGVVLRFQKTETPVVATRGTVVDHIGFEIDDLHGFVKRLEEKGIKLDQPIFTNEVGVHITFVTDPWGTGIELTEGLDKIQ